MSAFGDRLRSLRLELRMTQGQVAERIGVDVSYLSKIENGHMSPPSSDTIIKLANVFGVAAEDLLLVAGKAGDAIDRILVNDPSKELQVKEFIAKLARQKPREKKKYDRI